MAKPVATFDVEIDGKTTRVEVRRIEIVRAETILGISVGNLEPGMTAVYKLAWAVLLSRKTEGIPDTFDAFLNLEPDIEEVAAEADPKVSEKAPSTG